MYSILEERSKQRLADWYNFRQQLETSTTPEYDVVEFFKKFPTTKIYTDPYDQGTWPTAWELIYENEYCPFNFILAICYTLQLTSRFQDKSPIIKIAIDNINKTVYYLLFIDDKVFGYEPDVWIPALSLPKTLKFLKIYTMPPLH